MARASSGPGKKRQSKAVSPKRSRRAAAAARPSQPAHRTPTLAICLSASAAGLAAINQIVQDLPTGHGLAVIVQHLYKQPLPLSRSNLSRITPMKVVTAKAGMRLAADHVFVLSGPSLLRLENGVWRAEGVPTCEGFHQRADHLLCTLAADQGRRAAAVILSGTGSDGTHGLAEIRAAGGIAVVQDPQTAPEPEMPQSAITADVADAVLAPQRIGAYLLERATQLSNLTARQQEQAELDAILGIVRNVTGHDFGCYKRATLDRRIRRRMAFRQVLDYGEYCRVLRADHDEAAALRKDLLIGVTEFFRQSEAWSVLEDKAIGSLIAKAPARSTLRIWAPACSVGKEVYSLAMMLAERIEASGKKLNLQLFATDADASAVEIARHGTYAEDDLKGVSPQRLKRFFVRKNGRYEVIKALRELIVFAPQDLTFDPPFSKLDLISCRNLLIYLDPTVQKKVIQLFHFALSDGGYLFLGSAETIGGQEQLFEPLSTKWRIYRKLASRTPMGMRLPLRPAERKSELSLPPASPPRSTLPAIAHQALAERHGPPAAIVDRKGALLYLQGDTEPFLHMPVGEQTGLLADAAREGLRHRLHGAIAQAVAGNNRVCVAARVNRDRRTFPVKLTVSPLRHPREAEGLLMVTFEEQRPARVVPGKAGTVSAGSDVRQLEDELRVTREELQSSIEQLRQSNEHLKASNEEVNSSNEELQSANEELETSKEELQSLNDELNSVNQCLQDKVFELEQAGNDVSNLLTSGNIATVFLDRTLHVRRYTPAVTRLLGLLELDIGRSLSDVARRFKDDALLSDARRVLEDLTSAAAEVHADDGRWYLRRILPYRTGDDRIEGVAITFADITELKELTEALRASEAQARWLGRLPDENPNPVLRLSAEGTVLYRNPAATRQAGWQCEVGEPFGGEEVRRLLGRAMADGKPADQDFRCGGADYLVTVSPIAAECYANVYVRDITERKQAEAALAQSEQQVRHKLQSVLSPEGDLGTLELGDMIDASALQKLMDEFYAVAQIPMSIMDVKGSLLVGVGWQDICTRFHRVHSQTAHHCLESDTELSDGLAQGEARLYKCKNNLWDMATPIFVGGQHVGNIFTGQFFFDDETVDRKFFAAQARQYGFDESQYLAALDRVPRLSRSTVDHGMAFFLKLSDTLSQLGYSNVKLARLLTERDRLTDSLRQSEERLMRAQDIAHLGSWELELVHNELTWSDEVYRIFGLEPQEFNATYEAFLERVHPDDRALVDAAYSSSLREGRDHYEVEHRVVRRCDGQARFVHEKCEHFRDASGRIVRSVGMVHDITDRKLADMERETTVEFLRLVNQSKSTRELVEAAASFFQQQSGCQAVGIRVKQGEDYPYYQTQGFPAEFTLQENCLCSRDEQGRPVLDAAGQPVLECMCGNVISGRFDPSQPFFTARGSFWTNSTTRLLANTSEAQRRASTRNRCNGEGYESVALIALRVGQERLGLLQLNDKRPGQFAPETIARWERLADYLAVALSKFQAQESLRLLNAQLEQRVTERTAELAKAGEVVVAERQRLYGVLDTLPVYVVLLTEDYRVPFANRYFEERFGSSQGRRCYEYLFGRTEPCEVCDTWTVFRTGKPHNWHWVGPNGRDYDIYDFPFTDSDGSHLILEMGIDITDRLRAEGALKEVNETLERRVAERTTELARSNEDLAQFAYVASHDLQEPLRMINGFLNLLESGCGSQLDDKAHEYIHYSTDGAKRMARLISDLLDYSRVDRKGRRLQPTDTGRAMSGALANLHSAIAESGATVTHDALPTVMGDATQLTQLFQNLVGNAIKFRSADRPCRVHVDARQNDGRWDISVKDNGIGISPEQSDRIFVIFHRLHGRDKYPGTGIGLAICKRIVERHGGRLWVESAPGEGATFCFTLSAAIQDKA